MFNICIKSVTSHEHLDDWIPCYESPHPQTIFFNPQTQQYIQQHIFSPSFPSPHIPPQPPPQTYQSRMNNQNTELVNVIYSDVVKNIHKVWVEYMPCRLSDIGEMDLEGGLVVLREAGKGFERLWGMGWRVRVGEEMVGVNRWGFVKVWLSRYWHYNVPREEEMEGEEEGGEGVGVKRLVEIVKGHLERTEDREILGSIGLNCSSFTTLLSNLESYLHLHKFSLPQRLNFSSLNLSSSCQPFINLLQQFQSPKLIVVFKHKPHYSNFQMLRVSGNSNLINDNIKNEKDKDQERDSESKEKHKRLSLMNIDLDRGGESGRNLKLPTTPGVMNQRWREKGVRFSTQKEGSKEKERQREKKSEMLNDRFYKEVDKSRVEEGLFDSRIKETNPNTNLHPSSIPPTPLLNQTRRVQSQYNFNKLQFNPNNKFKKIRKQITNTIQIIDMYTHHNQPEPHARQNNHFPSVQPQSNTNDKTFDKFLVKDSNRSQCQLVSQKQLFLGSKQRSCEHLQLSFNDARTSRRNSNPSAKNQKPPQPSHNQTKYQYEFTKLNPTQLQGLKNNIVLNQIQAEFQEFLKNSSTIKKNSSPDPKNRKENSREIPNLQFSKSKTGKNKESLSQTKKYQYSNIYSNEVELKKSQIRAQTSRGKNDGVGLVSQRSGYLLKGNEI